MGWLVFFWFLCGVAAGINLSGKGRSGFGGFLLGALLGPVGLVIALVMPRNEAAIERQQVQRGESRKCPQCAELVKYEAKICRHCGADQTAAIAEAEAEWKALRKEQSRNGLIAAAILGAIVLGSWAASALGS
jgi:membrane protease subunit (stomatin/prohibitin family)